MQEKIRGTGASSVDWARAGLRPVDRRERLSHKDKGGRLAKRQASTRVSTRQARVLAPLALLAAFCLVPAAAQDIAIVGGTVIDGNGGAALSDAVIVVSGQRISAVGPRASVRVSPGGGARGAAGGGWGGGAHA